MVEIFSFLKDVVDPAKTWWSWRRLQHVSSRTILRLPRHLEDILQRCLEDVLQTPCKMSWRRLRRRKIVTLKTSWRHVLKISWRQYGGKQTTYWGYLLLTNLNVYRTNLYFTNLYLKIVRQIKNFLIRTQYFQNSSYFSTQAVSLFYKLKSLMIVWCCEISWIQIWHCRKG